MLKILDLEERVLSEYSISNLKNIMNKPIDYERVYEIIYQKRIEADKFFEKYSI